MDGLRTCIRDFCEFELELKATQEIHRKTCEPSIVKRKSVIFSTIGLYRRPAAVRLPILP